MPDSTLAMKSAVSKRSKSSGSSSPTKRVKSEKVKSPPRVVKTEAVTSIKPTDEKPRVKPNDISSSTLETLDAVPTSAKPGELKLDDPKRITRSLNLLSCNVSEQTAALYWICEAKVLKRIAQCVGLICQEVVFRVHKDCLYVSGMDKARSCVAECRVEASAFTKFNSKLDKFQLGISLPNFMKVLAPLRENDMVVFCLENETDEVIKVQGFYTYKRSNEFLFVKIRVEENNLQRVGLGIGLENPAFHRIVMSSAEFAELFKNYKDLTTTGGTTVGAAKNVNLELSTDSSGLSKFVISLPNDNEGVLGSTTLLEGTGGVKMENKPPQGQPWRSSVNADHIAKFGPFGAQLSSEVHLYMRREFPVACEYREKGIKLAFYLVPKVVGD